MEFKPISVNIAVMDYSAAVARAVAWLGNRYLLATPTRPFPEGERYITRPHGREWLRAPTRPSKMHSD
jgi:hypothetical protein